MTFFSGRRYLENINTEKTGLGMVLHGKTCEGTCHEEKFNSRLLGEHSAAMIHGRAMISHTDCRASQKNWQTQTSTDREHNGTVLFKTGTKMDHSYDSLALK